jgi:hypothetical protein
MQAIFLKQQSLHWINKRQLVMGFKNLLILGI